MFLSIIIPVYNTEKYISECLESCLNQDITNDDYEIICINDGSTDKSLTILNTYAELDERVKVISQQNGGVSKARNTGIDAARGDYIWFVDADDVIAVNCFGELKKRCLESKCDRLTFNMIIFSNEIPTKEYVKRNIEDEIVQKHSYKEGFVFLYLMRKKFICQYDMRFPENIAYGEDMVFNYAWKTNLHISEKYDEVLYYYRQHSLSAMGILTKSNMARKKRIESVIYILLWLRENGIECSKNNFNTYMALKYAKWLRILICELVVKLSYQDAKAIWKEIRKYNLCDSKYLYSENNEGQVKRDSTFYPKIWCEYRKERFKYFMKHPKRFLFGYRRSIP